MIAATYAGNQARTTSDASLPQNSSDSTCDDCDDRDAEGVNPDGRSLCRPCARRAETLIPDGGKDVLDRLASEFENRHKQAHISMEEYEERGEDDAANFEQGRVLAFQEARSAVLAVQEGDGDE